MSLMRRTKKRKLTHSSDILDVPMEKEILIKVEPDQSTMELDYGQLISLAEYEASQASEETHKGKVVDGSDLPVFEGEIIGESEVESGHNGSVLSAQGCNAKHKVSRQVESESDEDYEASQEDITHLITNTEDDIEIDEVDGIYAGENFGRFCCIECRTNFSTQESLESHMFSSHLDDSSMSYKCLICGFVKDRKKGMRMHLHQHTSFRPFRCVVCSMRFLRPTTLRFHLRTHKKRPKMDEAIGAMLQQSNLDFFRYVRVTKKLFAFLLRKLEEDRVIRKPKNIDRRTFKRPISTAAALLMTLSYLGRRPSFGEIADAFGSCESACHRVVWLIINYFAELSKKYIRWHTLDSMKREEKKFRELYSFPGIVGAIGTCPITIRTPENIDKERFSHWSCPTSVSLQILAVCDCKGNFLFAAVGNPGSESDEFVLSLTPLGKRIDSDPASLFHIPSSHLVGSDGYALRRNLIVPYRESNLNASEILFNKRLCEAKAVIDRSFYYLKGRFQRLTLIENSIENITPLLMACCVLHNLAISSEEDTEYLTEELDEFILPSTFPPVTDYELDMEAIEKRYKILQALL